MHNSTIKNCYYTGKLLEWDNNVIENGYAMCGDFFSNPTAKVINCFSYVDDYKKGSLLTNSLKVTNSFVLAEDADEIPEEYENINTTLKATKEIFASGKIAYLLQNNQIGIHWIQDLENNVPYPVLGNEELLKVKRGNGDRYFIGSCEHKDLEEIEEEKNTCEKSGHIKVYECKNCGSYIKDADATILVEKDEYITNPLGHDWINDGNGYICSRGDSDYAVVSVYNLDEEKTEYYDDFYEAWVRNSINDIFTLLRDIKVVGDRFAIYSLRSDRTIDLNGKKIETTSGMMLNKCVIMDSSNGSGVLEYNGADYIFSCSYSEILSGTYISKSGNSMFSRYSDQIPIIKGGSFYGNVYAEQNSRNRIQGGYFEKIISDAKASISSVLVDGYAFYYNDDDENANKMLYGDLESDIYKVAAGYSIENVKVCKKYFDDLIIDVDEDKTKVNVNLTKNDNLEADEKILYTLYEKNDSEIYI